MEKTNCDRCGVSFDGSPSELIFCEKLKKMEQVCMTCYLAGATIKEREEHHERDLSKLPETK